MSERSRREFFEDCSKAVAGAAVATLGLAAEARAFPTGMREARYYQKLPGNRVQCTLCPCSPFCSREVLTSKRLTHACNGGLLLDGQTCVCNVRTNVGGTLYATNYGRAGMLAAEPVEKNPLHHFLPGLRALTVSAPGCSLACKGCQNWEMALAATDQVRTAEASPERVVQLALEQRCGAIAFTYSEPMMFYEYMSDIARLARQRGLLNAVATCGYVNPEPLRELCGLVDAFTVSVKAFDDQAYMGYARGTLATVQKAMQTIRDSGRWLEVAVLVVPTVSDDPGAMRGFLRWMKASLGPDTPVHFLRFWPSYKLKNLPQTPVKVLDDARAMALAEGLRFAYLGNLPGHNGANTYCPNCQATAIRRLGFALAADDTRGGACSYCGHVLPGVWRKA